MQYRARLIGVAVGVGVLLAGGKASQAQSTVSYNTNVVGYTSTDFNSSLNFTQFDPSLGTLTGMTISITDGLRTTISIVNRGTVAASGSATALISYQLYDPAGVLANPGANSSGVPQPGSLVFQLASPEYDYSNLQPGNSLTSPTLAAAGTGSASYTMAGSGSLVSQFVGTGSLAMSLGVKATVSGVNTAGNATALQTSLASIRGTITYTYTTGSGGPPMPEPSAVTLAGSFGLLPIAARRLRRKAA